MLMAVDKDNYFMGFDVSSIESIDGTDRVIEADSDNWPMPSDLVKPKLVDGVWIEGATQEDIDYRNENQGVVASVTPEEELEPTAEQQVVATIMFRLAKLEENDE